ncbi:MAG: hypothetical protein ACRBBV_01775 [Paracoccaceae bacterium]
MNRVFPAILTVMSLAVLSSPAQAYIAENRVEVLPAGNGNFAVQDTRGVGPMEAWCAAASYAQVVMGAGAADRVYLMDGRDRGSRQPIIYTLTPSDALRAAGAGKQSLSVSVTRDGYNLTVSHARHFCTNPYFDD